MTHARSSCDLVLPNLDIAFGIKQNHCHMRCPVAQPTSAIQIHNAKTAIILMINLATILCEKPVIRSVIHSSSTLLTRIIASLGHPSD